MTATLLRLSLLFSIIFATSAQAWTPSNWTYWQGDYAYSHEEGTWYYVDNANSLSEVNISTGEWNSIDQTSGWVWFDWPYFLESGSGTAHWVGADEHYAVNLSSGEWSQIGSSSDSGSGSGSGSLFDGQSLTANGRDAPVRIQGSASGKRPVIVLLHGSGDDPEKVFETWRWLGDAIYVSPRGTNTNWNVPGGSFGVDDVDFVEQIVGQIKSYDNVDTNNITLLGYSNGGSLVNRLLIESPGDLFNNAITLAAALHVDMYDAGRFWADDNNDGNYNSERTPPFRNTLTIHGDEDTINPYTGGSDNIGILLNDARVSARALADAMGYNGGEPSGDQDYEDAVLYNYGDFVLHYRLIGGDHGLVNDRGGETTRQIIRDFLGM